MADRDIDLRIGRDELVLRQRYELLSIVNDIAVAVWFVAGSILFFSATTTFLGTWFFLVGSIQLLVRPVIRLTRRVHVSRISTLPAETGGDF